jgi:dipeptide transport system ATP-binding protein
MALLEISGLSVEFATSGVAFRAVDDVSLAVEGGEVQAIVGESGSGKSVAMLAVMGLLPPTAAVTAKRLTFDGLNLIGLSPRQRRKIIGKDMAMIFQEPMSSLNPCFTVGFQIGESLKEHLGLTRHERRDRTIALLRSVGITDAERRLRSFPHQLSGGMNQRVMIAMAIACSPKLIIADEPTTGLDPQARHLIWQRLRQLKNEGVTLILTTQYMEEAQQLCDRIVIMYQGKILKEGIPSRLIEDEIGGEVAEIRISSDQDERLIAELSGTACGHERVGDTLFFYSRDGQNMRHKLNELDLPNAMHRPASLEDVFLKLTGRSLIE